MGKIFHMLERSVAYNPEQTALNYDNRCLTYQELLVATKERANILKNIGIAECSKVGILVVDPCEFIINLFSVNYLNGIVMPIYFITGIEKVKRIIRENDINYIITSKELIYKTVYENMESNWRVYTCSSQLDVNLSDVSLILFTSGTSVFFCAFNFRRNCELYDF